MAGHALLADFGVAKALVDRAAAAEATEIGMAVGSQAYMAPEGAAGESVDRRTDVYAFGVLAYEFLGGQHPFLGTSPVQMMLAHLTREVPPLRGLRPGLPAELDAPAIRCLGQDPR